MVWFVEMVFAINICSGYRWPWIPLLSFFQTRPQPLTLAQRGVWIGGWLFFSIHSFTGLLLKLSPFDQLSRFGILRRLRNSINKMSYGTFIQLRSVFESIISTKWWSHIASFMGIKNMSGERKPRRSCKPSPHIAYGLIIDLQKTQSPLPKAGGLFEPLMIRMQSFYDLLVSQLNSFRGVVMRHPFFLVPWRS